MASELASMYVSITPNMSGFRTSVLRELRSVDGDAGASGSSSGNAFSNAFGRAIGGVGQALATVLKVGAGAAFVGIAAAGTVGIKTAAQLETAQIGFTTMLGSAEKAQSFLKDLTNFAAKTPFELPGLQQSASQLVATGIETEKVIPIMTTLGNITSGMGTGSEGIKRAVVAIQQMNAAQKIGAEDLNQLRDAGIPVYELLAKATGKSVTEVAALAQAGKLGKKELDQLMSTLESGVGLERFNGLMEKQSQSLSGLWSTAVDTFSIGMATALEPVIPMIKEGLGGATQWLGDVAIPAVITGLTNFASFVRTDVGPALGNLGDFIRTDVGPALGNIGDFIRTDVVPVAERFVSFIRTDLIPGLQDFGKWILDNKDWLSAIAVSIGTVVVALQIWSAVTKTMAAVQAVLNAVMAANPIGIIVVAIAALVAGLVWFFTQTELGKEIWANVWGFITTVTDGFVTWFRDVAMPWVGDALANIGAVFTWLYENIIKPVWDGISAAIGFVVGVITAYIAGIVWYVENVLAPVFVWLWQNVIAPVFETVSTIIGGFVAFFQAIGEIVIAVIQQWIAPAFMWLWEQVIVPAWNGIMSAIGAAWNWIDANVFKPIGVAIDVMGQLWNWYWMNIIVPVWQGIQDAIGAAWNWIDTNVFKPIGVGVDLLGQTFDFLWKNVIVPVWQGIQDAIGGAWNWIRDTVFTPLSDFIQKTIPEAFSAGKDAIGRAWDLIAGIVKKPIEFVVNTIINDGIIGAINTVRGWFQLEPLGRVALPAGWGSYAVGGYTGDGGRTDPAGIVHAGEIVWSQDDINRWGGVGIVEALRNAKGYAGGGLVSPLDNYALSQGFSGLLGHNGIDMAAPTGTPIHAAGPGTVSFAGWSVFGGGNETHIDHPNGLQTWYAHQNGFNVGQGATVNQGQTIGTVGATGLATGSHLHYMVLDGGWPFVLNPMDYLSGGGNAGSNPMGSFLNPLAGLLDGFMSSLNSAFPDAGPMLEVAVGAVKTVFDDAMKGISDLIMGTGDKSGAVAGSSGGPVLFDNGGWLEQTAQPFLMQHKRRDPDAVLTNSQWKTMAATSDAVQGLSPAAVASALRDVMDGAEMQLSGVDYLANAVSARILLAKQRGVS